MISLKEGCMNISGSTHMLYVSADWYIQHTYRISEETVFFFELLKPGKSHIVSALSFL